MRGVPHSQRFARHPVRWGWVALVTLTLAAVLAGAAVARLADPDSFESYGRAVWWALQTFTTVGYGDVIPEAGAGRVVAAFIMLSGVAFVAVGTALVTGAVVASWARRRPAGDEAVLAELAAVREELAALRDLIARERREP